MKINIYNEINKLLEIDESYKAPEKMLEILYKKDNREKLFKKFLETFDYDISYDWFREYYEEEQAERKSKKQDFTPQCVTELVSKIAGFNNTTYDCCCGTGGITISKWWYDCMSLEEVGNPFKKVLDYDPSQYLYYCEEYSDRTIPFLLFNLLVRGMNAIVIQCDVLTRESKGVFFIYNQKNNFLGFSDFNVMPYSEDVENEFKIKFVDKKYKEHIESEFEGNII